MAICVTVALQRLCVSTKYGERCKDDAWDNIQQLDWSVERSTNLARSRTVVSH